MLCINTSEVFAIGSRFRIKTFIIFCNGPRLLNINDRVCCDIWDSPDYDPDLPGPARWMLCPAAVGLCAVLVSGGRIAL